MIGKLLLLLSLSCIAFAPLKAQDRNTIEGTWILVSAELAGKKLPDQGLKDTRLILSDGHYTYQNDQGTYKLLPSEEPYAAKSMDITGTAGPNKGKTFLAIYELTGDTLRICYDLEGKLRPREFTTLLGTRQFLAVYTKAKQ